MFYLVTTKRNPQFNADHLPAHKQFMSALKASGAVLMSGPFTGGGGGYVLKAESLAAAEALVFEDPLHVSGSSTIVIREWDATVLESQP